MRTGLGVRPPDPDGPDCSVTWLDTRDDDTYCFTTRAARERFVKAARENIERARAHYGVAHEVSAGTAARARDASSP